MAIPGNLLSSTTESVDPNTSGWTPLLNCTLSLGTGGRNGDGCLAVKSVAAGEMQARTVSSYEVVAGTVYQVFADASASAQPERIGIRWLDAAGAEISVTWSLTTAAASSSWHRVGVAGAAPAGAARAQVLLSSTPAGAAVFHYWENIYLALPVRVTGNLLPFRAEQAELDTLAWEADTNATVTRVVPAVSWSSTYYTAGGHTLAVTATAGGNTAARTIEKFPAQEGADYYVAAFLNPPVSGVGAAWLELRFHDAAGVQISAARAVLDAPGTSWYRQRLGAVSPAGTASISVAVGRDGASAGQVVHAEEVAVQVNPLTQDDYNSVPYADYGFEQGPGAWTVSSGVATTARSTPWGSHFYLGSYSLQVSSATATASRLQAAQYPVTELESWRLNVAAKVTAGSWDFQLALRWFDATGTEISVEESVAEAIPTGGSWWILGFDATAPAGAVTARPEIVYTATATSSVLYMDGVLLRQVLPLIDAVPDDEGGFITVTLREMDVGDTLTLYREAGGQRTLVRGPDGLVAGDTVTGETLVYEDYEAPLGVPVRYRAEEYSTSSTVPDTRNSSLVTLDPGDTNEVWLKDPGNPHRNLRVMVQRAPDWDRPIEQAAHRVAGRRNPVVLSSVRGGLQGELAIWTRSDDERAALHWLLDSGAVLLWQAAPGHGVDDLYVSVGAVTEARTTSYAPEPWRAWSLALTEVDMPATVGVGSTAGRSWQDVLSGYGTWADVEAVYGTWEDVMFDTPAGG